MSEVCPAVLISAQWISPVEAGDEAKVLGNAFALGQSTPEMKIIYWRGCNYDIYVPCD